MSYHRGGQAGAVAVSYSTSPMAPHSPSRRYSSGTAGTTTTSGIGSTASKYSAYRSVAGTSSILDQPTSFYTSPSSAGSSLRSNYISSEYRRSYCAPGSFYSSTATLTSIRRNYSSEYSRANRSPARSVSSSAYGEAAGPSLTSASSVVANGGGRYSGSSTSSASSSSRERNADLTSAADIISRYSPAGYVPNIRQSSGAAAGGGSAHHWKHRSTSSSLSELFGGDEREVVERRDRPESSLSSSSSSGSAAATGGSLWSRSAKKRPPTSSTVLSSGGHARADSAASTLAEEGSPTSRSARNRLQAYRDERCGLNGLRNIGNTCFMNSVIQCLSNTRPLLEYLLNEQYLADINTTTSSMKGALIKAFSQVIHELWEVGGDHVVNTTSLKSQIQRFAPRFMGYSQQDAQEFLRYLLEGLHEDVNRVTTKLPPIHGDIPDSYTETQKAVESWKRYLRSEDSMVVDVFVGQLRSSLHCTSCDHVSVTLDPFWDLSLPIPARSGTVKLSQCLEHFTREEVLDGDEKPTCSKCQMRRKCTKSFSIQKFPKILVIHLKRFSPMERFRGKLNVMVDFPLTGLDLSAFAAPKVPGCTYNLYGVANHSGTTYSGHYTAYCKHPYSGEWHEYNDSRVSVVSARSVVSSEAYVLFYEQQPHSSHL
ncbi:ubiquitin carboxyl-terminal hydrolase 2 isoform X4 [Harpegnathos saltator]|uniref:ubiquitin carboxyl-terminal hydrolase 2 isoform X4 n=1 Tax=Harpegnathos saltator TaxID=610380 RepID=UPI000DBEE0DD|nr:ubiquitin carboxyl-terminal hydrolase 2 isoform X4 [Harpegnathos saltator]